MKKSEKKEKIVCVDCGRELLAEDEGYLWGKCQFCQKPVCFECAHYRGVYKKGLYLDDYVEALRLCKKCHVKEK